MYKRDIKNVRYEDEYVANTFISSSDQEKEKYAQQDNGRRYGNFERTITHLLLDFNPHFLELDAKWVDMLIEEESDMKDDNGWCNLIHLFKSEKLDGFDFGCKRFQNLL